MVESPNHEHAQHNRAHQHLKAMASQEYYGRVPREYVVSGALCDCNATELLVYLFLAAHAGDDFKAWPSVAAIARAINKTPRTVKRAITALIGKGHLKADRRGGKGNSSRYWLTSNSDTSDDTLTTPKDDNMDVTLKSAKGDAREPKGDNLKPNSGTQDVTRKGKGKNNASSSDVFLALREAGVTGKALDDLSKLNDLDAEDVRSVSRRATAKASDNPAGLLVHMLRDGERASSEDRAAKQRELKRKAATLAATQALEALPDPTPEQLSEAKAWRDASDRSRILSFAKQAYPPLFVAGDCIVNHYENERMLAACCQWAYENSMHDKKIIDELRNKMLRED